MFKTQQQRADFGRQKSTSGLVALRDKSNAFGIVHPNKDITAIHEPARMLFTDGMKRLDGTFPRQSFYDIIELAARGHTRPLREQLQALLDARPEGVAEDAAITAIINIAPPKMIDGQRDEANGAAEQPNGVDAQNYHSHIHVLYGESKITEKKNWARRAITGRERFLERQLSGAIKEDRFATLSIAKAFAQAPAENLYLPPAGVTSLQDLVDVANSQASSAGTKDALVDLAQKLKSAIDANDGQCRLVIQERPGEPLPLTIEMHLPQDGVNLGGRWFRDADFEGIDGKEPPPTKEPVKTISEVVMAGGTNSYTAFTPLT